MNFLMYDTIYTREVQHSHKISVEIKSKDNGISRRLQGVQRKKGNNSPFKNG